MQSIIRYITFVLLSGIVIACNEKQPEETTVGDHHADNIVSLTAAQLNTIGLKTDTLGIINVPVVKQVNGFVDVPPEKKITLSAPIGGFVERMDVLNGMKVKKGQFILSLKDQSFIQLQEQYLTTYHQWKVDKANFERQEALAAEKINAVKALEQSKATYDASSVMLEGMRARLSMMNVNIQHLESGKITNTYNMYAPVDGYVSNIVVNKGKYVSNAEALVDIVDVSTAYASINVFEKDLSLVQLNQKIEVLLSDGITRLPAKISFIGKAINEDRSVMIICNFLEKSEKILPGMYLTAFLELSNNSAIGIPTSAIAKYQGENFVFVPVEEGDKFEAIEVEIQDSNGRVTSIKENDQLKRGDRVVIIGSYDLLSKWKNNEDAP
ncbi:efflux RND transporter periplasmic adaptor subunit [Gynurincola endophyticus]|uniref:efflux RND transporter periplasmic adaptor subunit n=1 Tax=Gynurincola endophyticus TaxID=2479004 RepID=UPI000F8E73AB|nr:efflux RND transporter periplasmic adaptor subunit [Gynurincola endophyticus]